MLPLIPTLCGPFIFFSSFLMDDAHSPSYIFSFEVLPFYWAPVFNPIITILNVRAYRSVFTTRVRSMVAPMRI